MNEDEINSMLNFIRKNYDAGEVADSDKIIAEFGENKFVELMDRGLIYEPILGKTRVI